MRTYRTITKASVAFGLYIMGKPWRESARSGETAPSAKCSVILSKHEDLSSDSEHPCEDLAVATCVSHPSVGVAHRGRLLERAGWPG